MQKIKHLVLPAFLTLCVFTCVLYTSCKDKCGSTTCSNGGTCVNNICVCPAGYYGNSCQNSYSSPFIGTYNCSKSCNPAVTGGNWQSNITVASTSGGNTVYISSFGGSTTTAVATVDSTIDSIAAITITPSSTASISGTGHLKIGADSTVINITYTVASGIGTGGYTCQLHMVKQ